MPLDDSTEMQPTPTDSSPPTDPPHKVIPAASRSVDRASRSDADNKVADSDLPKPLNGTNHAAEQPRTIHGVGDVPSSSGKGDGTVCQEDADVADARRRSHLADVERFVPQVVGYRMIRRLGHGTFGVVWHAQNETTGIEVAIKFFARGTDVEWKLLQAEVMQLAKMHSDPGIIQLLDVDVDAKPPYFIMTYAPEGSLAQRLQKGPMPVKDAVRTFREVAEAMAYVHAKGIRHCDLKPGNILLDARGRARVADFGQAHFSDDASPALGTFFYMAPEQADLTRQIPDTHWDVYGMGALLYSMLTGVPPREDTTLRARLEGTVNLSHRLQHYRETVLRAPRPHLHRKIPGVDKELADIVDRCLAIDPAKRLRDAGAVLAALDRRKRIRHQRPLLIFALLGPLLFLAVLGALIFYQARTIMEEFQRGQEELVIHDNKNTAALVSNVVTSQLKKRVDLIARVAQERVPLFYHGEKSLSSEERDALAESIMYVGRNGFSSWAVTDAEGTFVAGHDFGPVRPGPVKLEGRNFSWRQWFNGQSDRDLDKAVTERGRYPCYWGDPAAKGKIAISDPYVNSTGNKCIGISTSVTVNGQLAGVFLANLDLDTFHLWLKNSPSERGSVVLLNSHGCCLFHSAEESTRLSAKELERLRQRVRPTGGQGSMRFADRSPSFVAVLRGEYGNSVEHFDPILEDGRRYLVGYAPLTEFGGGSLVQSDSEAVMRPVRQFNDRLRVWGGILLVASVALLLGLWSWFFRILKSEERLTHA